MRKQRTVRERIFHALAGFTWLVAIIAIITCLVSTTMNVHRELKYDRHMVENVRKAIEKKLNSGDPLPYQTTDIYENGAMAWTGNGLMVADKTDWHIISPQNAGFTYEEIGFEEGDDDAFFRHDGKLYFAIYSDMTEYPQRVIYLSSFIYAYQLTFETTMMFLLSLLVVLGLVLLITWKVILPKVEKSLREKQNAELELEHAATLQKMAISRTFPQDLRCDVYGVLHTAREIGGDLYGCILKDNNLYFIIGDVSDKGAPAALVMFLLSSISYPLFKSGTPLTEHAKRLNNILCDNPNYDMFCTAILGCIDLNTREMHFINAGHTRMLIDGKYADAQTNMPLGIMSDYPYVEECITLPESATLMLYTDGVTEERSETRELFGEERLLSWFGSKGAGLGAEDLCGSLYAEVQAWRGKAEQNDDIAILAFKFKK